MQKHAYLLLISIITTGGCSGSKDDAQHLVRPMETQSNGNGADKQKAGLLLSLQSDISKKATGLRVKCIVTNVGQAPIWWDREFTVFLSLSVKSADGKDLEPVRSTPIKSTPDVKGRFIQLRPGDSMSHEIDLAEGVREFTAGRRYFQLPDGGSDHLPSGSERIVQYVLPKVSWFSGNWNLWRLVLAS